MWKSMRVVCSLVAVLGLIGTAVSAEQAEGADEPEGGDDRCGEVRNLEHGWISTKWGHIGEAGSYDGNYWEQVGPPGWVQHPGEIIVFKNWYQDYQPGRHATCPP
jgi:hypothetical protein